MSPAIRTRRLRAVGVVAAVVLPLAFTGLAAWAAGGSESSALERIPAAIVNEDEMVTQTTPDGEEQPILAGRLVVTELTDPDTEGFDWRLTNAEDAEDALEAGEVQAIVTIPEDFSASIASLQGDDPQRAEFDIRTDDAHSYLAGSVAQSVGDGMAAALGSQITEQVIGGLYSAIGEFGGALSEAADGAQQIADGAGESADGAQQLADGTAQSASGAGELAAGIGQSASGAQELAGGVKQYTGGVSGVAGGLGELSAGVSNPQTGLPAGIRAYNASLRAAQADLADAVSRVQQNPIDPVAQTDLAIASATIEGILDQGGAPLESGATQLAGGIRQLSSGAQQLAQGGAPLASGTQELADGLGQAAGGADELAGGLGQLAEGQQGLADGLDQLADGGGELAGGLREGAEQVPAMDADEAADAAEIAASPVGATSEREHETSEVGPIIATFFGPIGLWAGAIAIALMLPAVSRRVLASTAATGRILGSRLGLALAATAAQAVLLVALLHTVLGVAWSALPATLGFSLLTAGAFTALHHLLTTWLGRTGIVVSLLLLGLQLVATGGLYPVQALAEPFRSLSEVLPLTAAVRGMQGIVTGGPAGPVLSAAALLLVVGLASVGFAHLALARTRRARALGLAA
ncbi:YhgE/Pip domain-containing protein [Homoserinibacter sp. YIM 151385]|uniref:YhgE/Pip domain-containing protein n=1 Tax=Homoserinibacter sp. YIM 151385 TaxID=2985506 RepID=UPI0022F09E60|nr:YhgE/Pip family protein [Homoserinibacter sp. YIM 151385]WBU39294.1 YhgE/Pip family protein [Homoserinibacter sp. YIM 151385]